MFDWSKWVPATVWLRHYTKDNLVNDSLAAVIVTIMLIPQSLAYALLAGLPPEMGLYASIFPLVAYAFSAAVARYPSGPLPSRH